MDRTERIGYPPRRAYSLFTYAGHLLTSTGRLLREPVWVHGVDLEAAAGRALNTWCAKTTSQLSTEAREDAITYLIATGWEQLEFRYDPGRNANAGAWVHSILSLRVTDWLRSRERRTRWVFSSHTYERPAVSVVSLDGPAGDGSGRTLGESVPGESSSSPPDRLTDIAGLGLAGDRELDRDLEVLREGAARIIEERAARSRERQRQKRVDLNAQIG